MLTVQLAGGGREGGREGAEEGDNSSEDGPVPMHTKLIPVQWQAQSCASIALVLFATQNKERKLQLTTRKTQTTLNHDTKLMVFPYGEMLISTYLLILLNSFKLLRGLLPQINIAVSLLKR